MTGRLRLDYSILGPAGPSNTPTMHRRRLFLWIILGLLLVAAPVASTWYTEWLWFLEVGYTRVFWVPLLSRLAIGAVAATVLWLLLYLNLRLPATAVPARVLDMTRRRGVYRLAPRGGPPARWLAAAAAVPALLGGAAASRHWVMLQQFVHATPFGQADPLFGRDVGFYVFRLPVYRYLADALFGWLVAIALAVAVGYTLAYGRGALAGWGGGFGRARAHLSLLAGAAVLARAAGFWLDGFELVYSTRGPVFGASFTDVHAVLPALRLLTGLFAACGLLLIANVRLRTVRPAIATLALAAAAWAAGLVAYPAAIQALRVRPNELTAETPYIARAIAATRAGFGVDRVREREFPATALDPRAVVRQQATIDNVRLWDYRPMLRTLGQIQTLRPYYTFADVDVDRYTIAGRQRQVMLAARELSVARLPAAARTWVNEHLVYTHGYGLVMMPVNRLTAEGMPEFFIKDIPPAASVPLRLDRPEIYFGELTTNYVVVNTAVPELDYPRGDDNVYAHYRGRGGIRMSALARLAMAYRFGDVRLALSRDIGPQSRLLFRRQIVARARQIAPFLRYDRDPYLVLADGRLVWILDAYTTTDRYPYATRYGDVNYIRNSVKVVIDAYEGRLTFYLMVPEDPIARTFARVFPTLFRPVAEMPAAVAAHLRYPVDLFELQAQVYATFHMRDPQVFYNREDAWQIPSEVFGNETVRVEPYYVTMALAEGSAPEFVLILPFSPAGRDNMIAWMAARNDPPHYGELIAYRFPKARIVFGPMQIEARINQDPLISQQLTLWNQQGSQVIRGNLLVIPIEDGLLYVEPLFLQAERSQLPELKRVIVADGAAVVMAPTLEAALAGLLGGPRPPGPAPPAAPPEGDLRALTAQALAIYRAAQERLRAGDLAGYSQEMARLGPVLERLDALTRPR
ncbi:MAG: UPF0182 family protein [Armatimonadota bacterium]|nr:UPF0182 family protein [Armatimonadota bacterium]